MAKGKESKYIEGVGWRRETEHSMHRRMQEHDYYDRCIYMITMCVENRQPLLGRLVIDQETPEVAAHIEPTDLGRAVERCWFAIKEHYPEAEPLKLQLMPDHIHGLLFVTREQEAHLGKMLRGFKIGCTWALWERRLGSSRLGSSKNISMHGTAGEVAAANGVAATPKQALFEAGYQDSILMGKDQLEHMIRYMEDNPKRLAIKRLHPDLFRVVRELKVKISGTGTQQAESVAATSELTFAAIGNRWLLDKPLRLQVRCHNNTTPENLQLIASQKANFLERGKREGAVIISPCISAGEKEIARAALDAKIPLIVILENGFPPMYKPPGKYFEACTAGVLLMLAPWPHHMETRKITRQQCLALNAMAKMLSTE